MKILKENNLFWLIGDDGEKLFSSFSLSGLMEKLNATLTISKK